MAKFIKIPFTEKMENDYKECAEMIDDGVEKCCESCSLSGGNFGCIGEYQWCKEDS